MKVAASFSRFPPKPLRQPKPRTRLDSARRFLTVNYSRHMLFVSLFVLMVGLVTSAAAQDLYTVDTKPPRGFMPTSDQLSSPIDSIDAVNGKLHLQVPLGSLPRGKAGSGFDLELNYDSHLYDL